MILTSTKWPISQHKTLQSPPQVIVAELENTEQVRFLQMDQSLSLKGHKHPCHEN